MAYRYDTYCGVYCGACHALRATEEGRVEEQAKAWGRDPEEVRCHGCKSDVFSGHCRAWGIKSCAVEREVEFCFECAEYPCDRLIAFRDDEWPHHSAVTRNLAELERLGLARWLEVQAARWRCPACGHKTSWYDETCPDCGSKVVSSRDEEQTAGKPQDQGGR